MTAYINKSRRNIDVKTKIDYYNKKFMSMKSLDSRTEIRYII